MNRSDTIQAADLALLLAQCRVVRSKKDPTLFTGAAVALAEAHELYIACGLSRRAAAVARYARRLARRWAAGKHARCK